MKNFNSIKRTPALLILAAVAMTGCIKEPDYGNRNGEGNGSFAFATSGTRHLTVNYRYTYAGTVERNGIIKDTTYSMGYERNTIFSVYADYPLLEDGSLNTALEPVLRAMPDQNGYFSDDILLSGSVGTIWLVSTTPGTPHVVELDASTQNITFDMATAPIETKATTAAGYKYPDDMVALYGWDKMGYPTNVVKNNGVPKDLLKEAQAIFKYGQNLRSAHPAMFEADRRIAQVVPHAASKIELVFLSESSIYRNVLGYYTYDAANPPTSVDQIKKKVIALPNASMLYSDGSMKAGDRVPLKYWNETLQRFEDSFPKNTAIAFILMVNNFYTTADGTGNKAGDIAFNRTPGYGTYYSNFGLHGGDQQFACYRDDDNDIIVCGAETSPAGTPNRDFCDILFYLESAPGKSLTMGSLGIDDAKTPDVTPETPENKTVYSGTLIYEDLWPYRGDFDMNDVVVEYTCTVWRNEFNNIYKTVDVFRPVHCGAALQNGFAFQYGVSPSAFDSFTATVPGALPKHAGGTFFGREEAPHRDIWGSFDPNQFEPGQDKAVVRVFEDIRVDGRSPAPREYRFETSSYNRPVSNAEFGFPPYNPFIIIVHPEGDTRNRELHLQGHAPTNKGTHEFFNYGRDRSNVATGDYYRGEGDYPFAISIPITNFSLPNENTPIDEKYTHFNAWATSGGVLFKDWYIEHNPGN